MNVAMLAIPDPTGLPVPTRRATLQVVPAVAPQTRRPAPSPPRGRLQPAAPTPAAPTPAAPTLAGLPRPRLLAMAEFFTVLFLEVEAGRRPRSQLRRFMSPHLYARLDQCWLLDGDAEGQLRRITGQRTTATSFDTVALLTRGPRTTALACRLQRSRRGWLVEELCRPERGPLPLPAYRVPAPEYDDEQVDDAPTATP